MRYDKFLPKLYPKTYRLDNGLNVSLLFDNSLPIVAINMCYGVGSKDDIYGKSGLAHICEHMMFHKDKNHQENFFKSLENSGGNINGATDVDRTCYWEILPSNWLEIALWLEAERMKLKSHNFSQEIFKIQMEVVRNERKQNYEEKPYGTVWEHIIDVLYPSKHPYSLPTIGKSEELDAITLDDLDAFYRKFYVPNNAYLSVVGDFFPDTVSLIIEKFFGEIKPGLLAKNPPVPTVSLSSEIFITLQESVKFPCLCLVWPTVSRFSENDAALDAAAHLLGGKKNSWLHRRLVDDLCIAHEVTASHISYFLSGTFVVTVTVNQGVDLDIIKDKVQKLIADFLKAESFDDEIKSGKNALVSSFMRSMEEFGGGDGLADRFNEYSYYLGYPDGYSKDIVRYFKLTHKSIFKTVERYLNNNCVIAKILPQSNISSCVPVEMKNKKQAQIISQPNISSNEMITYKYRPITKSVPRSKFFQPRRDNFTLANGMEVIHVENRRSNIIALCLLLRAGSTSDPIDLPGLASVAAEMLQEDTKGLSGKETTFKLESLGATLDIKVSSDYIRLLITVGRQCFEEAFDILACLVLQPKLENKKFWKLKARRLNQLLEIRDDPKSVTNAFFQKFVFANHPYGHPILGTINSIKLIEYKNVTRYWETFFVPANTVLVVVGEVSRKNIEKSIARNFEFWQSKSIPNVYREAPPTISLKKLYMIDAPFSTQSTIITGHIVPHPKTYEFASLETLNMIFGGRYTSRLNQNLRERLGVTYGAYSRFGYGLDIGSFSCAASVKIESTAMVVSEIFREISNIVGKYPPTESETLIAKDSLINSMPFRFATAEQVACEIADSWLYGLSVDYAERLIQEIDSLSPYYISSIATNILKPEALTTVIMGDSAKILPQLKAMGLSNMTKVFSIDGR